jgi:hypothetical protein
VENAGAAVSGFTGEGELGACTIEFGAPFDELGDVLGAFFDEEGNGFGTAEAIAGVEGVLLVEANFVFVGEGDGNAALRVGGGGFVEIGFGEDEDRAGLAELDGGADTCYTGADDEIIGLVGLWGVGHGTQEYGSTGEKSSEFSVVSFQCGKRELF